MHAVGDMRDGNVFVGQLRPELMRHSRGDLAVDPRHTVLEPRAAHRKRGHVEVSARPGAAKREQRVGIDRDIARVALEISGDTLFAEVVVTGRHRGVGGKNGLRRNRLERRGKIHAAGDELAYALQHQESSVAFVHVPNRRRKAESGEGAHAPDAEHDFLIEANRGVAAVQAVSDAAIVLCILGNIGVQQVKRDVARDGLPYANRYEPFGELDTYAQFGAVFFGEQRYWQLVEVGIRIGGLLIAFAVDGLEKIALAIEQSNAHQRDAHIARSLAVVAGENTQSAGVDGKALVKAELGAKVCDEIVARENVRAVRADLLRVVRVVCRQRPVQVGAKNRIVACLAQSLLVDLPQG